MDKKRVVMFVGGAAIVGVVGFGAVQAVSATVGDDDGTEVPITGEAYDRASAAALAHIGEGRVTDTEVGDEEGFYEVEVTRDDGSEVDVHLDENFTVLGSEDEDPDEVDDD